MSDTHLEFPYSWESVGDFVYRCLDEFDFEVSNVVLWRNFMEFILDTVYVGNKNAFVLFMIHSTARLYIEEYVYPDDPNLIPTEMLLSILEEKYSPSNYKYYIACERLNFRYQFPCESAQHYFNDLVKLLSKVHVTDSSLANRFIWGLEDRELRERLETIPDITPQLALMIATYSENTKQSFKYV